MQESSSRGGWRCSAAVAWAVGALWVAGCGSSDEPGGNPGLDGEEPPSSCTPVTCESQAKNCGALDDGCGNTVECGTCAAGQVCGTDASANVCIIDPETVAGDWPMFRHDVSGTGRAPGIFTQAQARSLTLSWTSQTQGYANANPVVVGDTVYIVSGAGWLNALNAQDGKRKWRQSIGVTPPQADDNDPATPQPCWGYTFGPVGAPAVVGSRVYATGGDGKVYSFDKDSGEPGWATPLATASKQEALWSSVFPLKDKLFIGISTIGESNCGVISGRVEVLDQATGALSGTWFVDPELKRPGAPIWTQPAYDPRNNRLYVSTGNLEEGQVATDIPLAQAVVAINPDTLATLDYYQPVPNPFPEDFDFGAAPSLFDTIDGRHLLAVANKNGYVYAFDRDNLAAGEVWNYRISDRGVSPDLGESTIVSAAFAKNTLFVGGGKTVDGRPGAVAALDPATGTQKWIFYPKGYVLGSLTAAGDTVLVASTDRPPNEVSYGPGTFYVLSQATGEVLFEYATPISLFAQPTYANGSIYFGDVYGVVYALRPRATL
ncbi:MAG TPA: PQQ-binding-like beta-propeller repeat protein, partial [Myxococcaceae bacterium]|nr:PQQ-binding-like beta-propeller repeat protein [Myxococcaceae bacterium]